MKPLKDYREDYYGHSGRASEVARTLALSGIAVIWVFAVGEVGNQKLPRSLLWPGAFIVATLALDLLQYAWQSAIWGGFARYYEKNGKLPDDCVTAPAWFNWPALWFFWGKLATVAVAYFFLLKYILQTLF